MSDVFDVPQVAVLDDPVAAAAVLDPTRARLLAELAARPASSAGVAARLDLPRQRVNHHLRVLQQRGLLVEVARRRHGGLVERILAASARSYLVSPTALGPAAARPDDVPDRLSAAYLVAVAARAIREVGAQWRAARAAGKPLPTLTVDTQVRFASAADRAAFTDELAQTVRALVARYHDAHAPGGRTVRVVVLAHPRPTETAEPAEPAEPEEDHPR